MESLLQDIRYALRLLRKSPGFAAAAILTLALGMGANSVMFSVLNTVLLRPLNFPHPDRLIQIWETDPLRREGRGPVSAFNFMEWRRQNRTFAAIATEDYNPMVLSGRKAPQRINAEFVSAGFFDVYQTPALMGRTFNPDEDQPGNERVVVISYGAWSRYFDRSPEIIGTPVTLDEQSYVVIGVMPPEFGFPNNGNEAWCLPGFDPARANRRSHGLRAIGRLNPGISLQQAQADMNTIAENLNRQDGGSSGVRLAGLQDELVGNFRRSLLVLWAAVSVVLLIACANVAGLLLARAAARQKEVAVRSALGGSRRRIIQQFLTESVLLAVIGGILGVGLAYAAGRFLIVGRVALPRLRDLHFDGWVLGFSAFACIVTGLAFGIVPALHALRFNLNQALKEGGGQFQVFHRLRLRSAFVVVELALATVLLVAGGLLTKTLWRLQQIDPGFQTENILTFRFSVPDGKYNSRQRGELYERVVERLAAIPGVESAGATNDLPFAGSQSAGSFKIEGRPLIPGEALHSDYRRVSPNYLQTMRMRLLAGREFTEHDNYAAPAVAIVNQAFVKRFLPDQQPLGRRIMVDGTDYYMEIVGVIADAKLLSLSSPAAPEIYAPYLQASPQIWTFVAVRSHLGTQELSAAVRSAVKEVAPGQPIYRMNSMTQLVEYWMSPRRFSSVLLGTFAGLALLLAAIGIYGVIAYSVVQRTREIGIRMALGADLADVRGLILGQGARMGLVGLATGTVVAFLVTRALSSMLFEVSPYDFGTFALVAASLMIVVLLASFIPARKAMKVDPLIALRHE